MPEIDNNNWMLVQAGAEPAIDNGDWRSQLPNDSRPRIVNQIMDTLKEHFPCTGPDSTQELKKIATRFEEKIYTNATNQNDYLRKISTKMLNMELKTQNTMANSLPSNSAGSSENRTDAGPLGMQPQTGNPLSVSIGASQSQARQQLLAQNMQNNVTETGFQGSSSLTPSSMSNIGQHTNLQNMQGISEVSQNSGADSMGQGVPANMYANTQREMQGREVLGQHSQQSQQQQQYRQKFPQGNIQNPLMQSQQNLLQPSQQSVMQSNLQQNQQSSVQQLQSMLQQNQQSVLRQHLQFQPQSMLTHPKQQQQQQNQQQLLGQQPNSTSLHPNQLLGQQTGMSDLQWQQRLFGQQKNLSNPQQQLQQQLSDQQQLDLQGNAPGLHHYQQQMLGPQSGNSSMQNNQLPVHMLQQTKVSMPQQNQQNTAALQHSQGQHSQSQMPPQQLMPQIQSQPGQLQQKVGVQQHQNPLHRDMQQRLQSSGPLLQSQNMIDQQKQQLFQSQRTLLDAPSTSLDSTAQTGDMNGGDWQEEVYQKIKTMKEAYLPELTDMYMKIAGKLQQHDSLPQQPIHEQVERQKNFKTMLERSMMLLQVTKNNVLPAYKEKLGAYEKQIINILNSNRARKSGPMMQQPQLPSTRIQQQSSQMAHIQPQDNSLSSQVHLMNVQGSANTLPQNIISLQQCSSSSLSTAPIVSQSMMNSLPSNSNICLSQGNTHNTMQQAAVGMQQSVSAPQQSNPNMLPPQQPNQQEQHMVQSHQLKRLQQHQIQQQQQQKQQHMLQQTKLQQNAQSQAHQMPQLHQVNDMDMKFRQQLGVKGGFQQNQRSMYQQLKSGSSFSTSSSQLVQAGSPQMVQHSSPQIGQRNLLPSLTKLGTPLQSANSPYIVPSPCSPLNQSPMPGESEKATSGFLALPSAGALGHQQPAGVVTAAQSLAIGTPGISASPLLAESTSPGGTHGNISKVVSGNSSDTEQPIDRLLKAVKSMSPNALRESVSDIGSVVGMIDRIAGSPPGIGSRAAVGEDLVSMTASSLQPKDFVTQDENGGTRKMKRYSSSIPLIVASSARSVYDSFKHMAGADTTELELTASLSIKRPKLEASHALLEEIREINHRLIDTVVDVSDEDMDAIAAAAAASEGGEGTIVKCSYCANALSPNFKSIYTSAQMSPIQPLRLLVPSNYPNSSPILLDKFPLEVSKGSEDLSTKLKSRFSLSLWNLSQPMSLREIARVFDVCAREVISEYAQQSGGGSFSSKYGTWENCATAA